MKLLKFLQNNKLFVHYVSFVVIVIGVATLFRMQREARPNVNFNRVAVALAYPGASPEDIEELVIDPIEEKIAEVDGVKEYRSVSFMGAGSISVQIDDTYPNPEDIVDELRRKISEVNDLPTEVKDPVITEIKASSIPVLNLALYGSLPPDEFKLETDKLIDFLKLQDGVQSVGFTGLSDLQLQVSLDPKKLDRFDITSEEVAQKISGWAKQKPGGLFEGPEKVANITIGKNLGNIEDLRRFVVRSNDSGNKVQLSDIAQVKFDLESSQTANIFYDNDAVLLTVVKKPFYDAIDIVDSLKTKLKDYEKTLSPQLKIKLYKDQSIRIRNKLKIVSFNALTGLFLVLLILIIFLDWRSSIVTSIGIPIAILGGVIVLYSMGQTINSLVVIGIIIVLGMLVDDAIVVCENIYSYIEKGLSPMQAAYEGVKEISLPVIASVLTTIFAFLPIVFMEGIIGQFLSVIPLTVIAMLAVSLLEALTILPIHSEELMRPKKNEKVHFFKRFEDLYRRYITWSINKRWFLTLGLSLFLAFSMVQGKRIFERFSLFPAEGLEGLSVRVELEKNSPLKITTEKIKLLSQELLKVSDGTFDNIYSNLGQVTTGGSGGSRQNGTHLGVIYVTFTSDSDFIYKEKQIVTNIRKVVKAFKKEHQIKASVTLDRPGPPIGKPIQFQVTSRDFSFGEKIILEIKQELLKIKGVNSLETDLDGDSLKYRVEVDNERAVSEGVNPSVISQTIFTSSTGKVTNEVLKNSEKIEILLRFDSSQADQVNNILKLKVRNSSGQAVPLESFAKVIQEKGPSSIQRLNGLRTITLFGEVDEEVITGKEVNKKIKPFIDKMKEKYPTITLVTGGGEKDRLNALKDTMKLYILALLLIFMVISLTFNSVVYPFIVLSAIPMGVSGVIWSLVIHGKSLSLMGIIGIVGLSGVVVNVSIILLKFVQDRLIDGMEFRQAITEAGVSRLRPIVMTTVSTLIGLLPTIYGVGGIDTFVQPIALVLGWGLFVATIMTLLFLPAVLSFFTFLKPKI